MKRFLSFILTLCLIGCFSGITYAETSIPEFSEKFSIRNGIGYQQSRDSVIQLEKERGNLFSDYGEDRNIIEDEYAKLGDHDCRLYYYFDSSNKLASFHYFFIPNVKSTMKTMLENKYGKPLLSNKISPIMTSAWEELDGCEWNATNYKVYRSGFELFTVNSYDSWYVKFSDCYVVIELLGINAGDYRWTVLGYVPVSYSKAESALSEIGINRKSIEESYKNDL